jgi:hypothetical protein
MTAIEPKLDQPDVGSPDDHSHYARKSEIARAAVEGGLITALCGVKFQPVRNPDPFPVCERCKQIIGQLADNPGGPTPN